MIRRWFIAMGEFYQLGKAANEASHAFDAFGIIAKEAKRNARKRWLRLWPFQDVSFGLRYWEHHVPLEGYITVARSSVLIGNY